MAVLFEAAVGYAVSKAGDVSIVPIKAVLKKKAAEKELGLIGAAAVEAAILVEPAFAEDFRSTPFLNTVMVPVLLDMLANPGRVWDSREFATHYLDRFVRPYLRDKSEDAVLARIYRTDASALQAAFVAFLDHLRSALFASKHWKEQVRDAVLAEMREGISSLKHAFIPEAAPTADLNQARKDAATGSAGLRDWTRDIQGEEIDRPELAALLTRIDTMPCGRTLLIGEAGAGKSALLARLTAALQRRGTPVFAIKADLLPPEVRDLTDLSQALGLEGRIDEEIAVLAAAGPMVLLIDQLDAVSDVMDRTSQRMRVLLSLANHVARRASPDAPAWPVHVIVSSRPFEAAHDARFQSLQAEDVNLSLLSASEVDSLLKKIGIAPAIAPASLRETLRRPFALRLFVELALRGPLPAGLAATGLLNAWLASAKLGEGQQRADTLAFLSRLAGNMTETETLWRPADLYEVDDRQALAIAQASGLIVRQGHRIGFSHQAWLDDFQAHRLSTGAALCDFIWSRQDGLFSRATALRALQRLRNYEEEQYVVAIDKLLGEARTRRHIRHLVVDMVATQAQPLGREQAWVYRLIQNDAALGRRAIGKALEHWGAWREGLMPLMPWIMSQDALQWSAIDMLRAEAVLAPDEVETLLLRHWRDEALDLMIFEVCWRSGLWTPGIRTKLAEIFGRRGVRDYAISEYAGKLVELGRIVEAGDLMRSFVQNVPPETLATADFERLEKFFENASQDAARALMPWLLGLQVDAETIAESRYVCQYPRLSGLPLGWSGASEGTHGLYLLLRSALTTMAKAQPDAMFALIRPALDVELDEVQGLIADMLAIAAPALVDEAVTFLLADPRRLNVGGAYLEDVEGVGRMVDGWSAQELLRAIGPHLSQTDAIRLRDAIAVWDQYKELAWTDAKGAGYRDRLRWAQEARMPLLEALPARVLGARLHRQVREWRTQEPKYRARGRGMTLSAIGSPMSAGQMARADNSQVLGMLDAVDDSVDSFASRRHRGRGRWPNTGGASQLSQSFGDFAKLHPDRAFDILERLDPARHRQAAGSAVRALAALDVVAPHRILQTIRDLNAKGFDGRDWRRDVGWGLADLSRRTDGLEDGEITMLESWLRPYAPPAPDMAKDVYAKRAKKAEKPAAHAVIFGQGGGMAVVPQGNYTMLATILDGLLRRPEPNYKAWLDVLERHLAMPEDPEIWATVLAHRGQYLLGAERARARAFVSALWKQCPEAFDSLGAAHFAWSCRPLLSAEVIEGLLVRWLGAEDPVLRQAAGEYAAALHLLGEASLTASLIACALIEAEAGPARIGTLFAAAAAWREHDPNLRAAAHHVLESAAPQATADMAQAVASAVDRKRNLPPDEETRTLLAIVMANADLMGASLNGRLLDALQALLLHPGFEEPVLAFVERCAGLLTATGRRGGAFIGDDMVSISIALQRNEGPIRARAMNLYERLLDANTYGADQAATAALRQ